jgi:hypothetical protein
MPLEVKLFFTVPTIILIIVIWAIPSGAIRPGPDWFWRWGRNDPARRLLFRTDSLKKYARVGIIAWLCIFLLVIWLALPTGKGAFH